MHNEAALTQKKLQQGQVMMRERMHTVLACMKEGDGRAGDVVEHGHAIKEQATAGREVLRACNGGAVTEEETQQGKMTTRGQMHELASMCRMHQTKVIGKVTTRHGDSKEGSFFKRKVTARQGDSKEESVVGTVLVEEYVGACVGKVTVDGGCRQKTVEERVGGCVGKSLKGGFNGHNLHAPHAPSGWQSIGECIAWTQGWFSGGASSNGSKMSLGNIRETGLL
eukprot:1159253-Pelagomonas_calceolata.AAC.8